MNHRLRTLTLAAIVVCGSSGDVQTQKSDVPASGAPLSVLVDPGAPDNPTPSPVAYTSRKQVWLLGDLLYGREYHGAISITNTCSTTERHGIFVYGLPDVTVTPMMTVAAGRTVRLPYLVKPRQRSSSSPAPLTGELVVWRPGSGEACPPLRIVHAAHGQLRAATETDEATEVARLHDAAMRVVCMTWWLDGERPSAAEIDTLPLVIRPGALRADDASCAHLVRPAARSLRKRLADANATPPAGLPDAAALDRMTMAEIVAFREQFGSTEAAKEK